MDEALKDFRETIGRAAARLAQMPEEVRRRPRAKHHSLGRIAWQTVGEDATVTLEYLMLDYIEHLKNHLRQALGEAWR